MRLRIERAHDPSAAWRKAILLIGVVVVYVLVSNKREACEVGLIQSEHFLELMSKLKTRRFAVAPYGVPVEVNSEAPPALMPSL